MEDISLSTLPISTSTPYTTKKSLSYNLTTSNQNASLSLDSPIKRFSGRQRILGSHAVGGSEAMSTGSSTLVNSGENGDDDVEVGWRSKTVGKGRNGSSIFSTSNASSFKSTITVTPKGKQPSSFSSSTLRKSLEPVISSPSDNEDGDLSLPPSLPQHSHSEEDEELDPLPPPPPSPPPPVVSSSSASTSPSLPPFLKSLRSRSNSNNTLRNRLRALTPPDDEEQSHLSPPPASIQQPPQTPAPPGSFPKTPVRPSSGDRTYSNARTPAIAGGYPKTPGQVGGSIESPEIPVGGGLFGRSKIARGIFRKYGFGSGMSEQEHEDDDGEVEVSIVKARPKSYPTLMGKLKPEERKRTISSPIQETISTTAKDLQDDFEKEEFKHDAEFERQIVTEPKQEPEPEVFQPPTHSTSIFASHRPSPPPQPQPQSPANLSASQSRSLSFNSSNSSTSAKRLAMSNSLRRTSADNSPAQSKYQGQEQLKKKSSLIHGGSAGGKSVRFSFIQPESDAEEEEEDEVISKPRWGKGKQREQEQYQGEDDYQEEEVRTSTPISQMQMQQPKSGMKKRKSGSEKTPRKETSSQVIRQPSPQSTQASNFNNSANINASPPRPPSVLETVPISSPSKKHTKSTLQSLLTDLISTVTELLPSSSSSSNPPTPPIQPEEEETTPTEEEEDVGGEVDASVSLRREDGVGDETWERRKRIRKLEKGVRGVEKERKVLLRRLEEEDLEESRLRDQVEKLGRGLESNVRS